MKQKDVFLQSEGNAWFTRNSRELAAHVDAESDLLLAELPALTSPGLGRGTRILEIGCGEGRRLAWLTKNHGCECLGIDPSTEAVEAARKRGIPVRQGTADQLPFPDKMFDIVMFGFCLYLCDREDLFQIASEADRVLKDPGWLLILDFYATAPSRRAYHHRAGLFSYKMDYRMLFSWHPGYVNFLHKVRQHPTGGYTDERDEWIAVSVLRKNLGDGE